MAHQGFVNLEGTEVVISQLKQLKVWTQAFCGSLSALTVRASTEFSLWFYSRGNPGPEKGMFLTTTAESGWCLLTKGPCFFSLRTISALLRGLRIRSRKESKYTQGWVDYIEK